MILQTPTYSESPVGSVETLCGIVGCSPKRLEKILNAKDKHFSENTPEVKSDGSLRYTYRLSDELKLIHKKIIKFFFYKVSYPLYLQGSIRDKNKARTYITDAKLHLGAKTVISEDVSNFFGRIEKKYVLNMWKMFFCLPNCVAETLSELTTFRGVVPQGAGTSSYIANLILWDKEPRLVAQLSERSLIYSRYVDDITVSKKSGKMSANDKHFAISAIYKMLHGKKLRPNRRKHCVMNGRGKVAIHRVNINAGRATFGRKRKDVIRIEVYNLEKSKDCRESSEWQEKYRSTKGKILELKKLHPDLAEQHLNKLISLVED